MLFSFEDIDRNFARINAARFGGGQARCQPAQFEGRGIDAAWLASAFPGIFAQFEPRGVGQRRPQPRGPENEARDTQAKGEAPAKGETAKGEATVGAPASPRTQRPVRVLQPRFELSEIEGASVLRGDLPGVNAEDLKIDFEGGLLSITGRRYLAAAAPKASVGAEVAAEGVEGTEAGAEAPARPYLEYQRRFRLSKDIDAERIAAHFELGVLTLTLPRIEAEKPKKIAVKVN